MFVDGVTAQPGQDVSEGVGHLITVVLPHVLIAITALLNFFQSRRNAKEIKVVNEVLNGARTSTPRAYRAGDK